MCWTDELCEARLSCTFPRLQKEICMDDLKTRFKALLEKHDEAHLEYEEKHEDAGSGYVHLLTEESPYGLERLKEFMLEHYPEFMQSKDDWRKLAERFDEWSVEMKPGHRFTTIDESEGCCVGSWPLEEVENQHEVKLFADELDCTEEEIRELVRAEKDHCVRFSEDSPFDTFESYQCTGACWFCVVPRSWINDTIEEIQSEED